MTFPTDLKFCAPWLADKENFEKHEIVLNNKQLCKKLSESKLCEIPDTHRKGSSLLLEKLKSNFFHYQQEISLL